MKVSKCGVTDLCNYLFRLITVIFVCSIKFIVVISLIRQR